MDLVFDKVMELEHILDSDHGFFLERFTSFSIIELDLAVSWNTSLRHEI